MMKAKDFFIEALNSVPADVKRQVDLSMGISDRIAEILKERGMSQKDLAKLMGKTEAEVSRWLGGTHNFTIFSIAKISAVLGEDIVVVAPKPSRYVYQKESAHFVADNAVANYKK